MTGDVGLAQRQDGERAMVLHRAIAVAHRRAQRAHAAALSVSVAVAALSVLARTVPHAAGPVAATGAVWAAVYAVVVAPWAAGYQRMSATLQEMLDVELFDLPWNRVAVGDRITEDTVSWLSRRFRGDEGRLRGYYLIAKARAPYDVLFCLEQNLAWGSRVRQRYAQRLLALAVLWGLTGVVVGVVQRDRISDLAGNWLLPSLGFVLLCLDTYRAQISNTKERTRVLALVHAAGEDPAGAPLQPGPAWTTFARQVQDVLFQMRRQQPRVPVWFFRRFHDADLADFTYRMQRLEQRVGAAPTVTTPTATAAALPA